MVFGKLPWVFKAAAAVMVFYSPALGSLDHTQQLIGSPENTPGQLATICRTCHLDMSRPLKTGSFLQRPALNMSLLCLSCHDGVIGPAPPTSDGWFSGAQTLGVPPAGISWTEEVGHHPVGTAYKQQGGSGLHPYEEPINCALPLYRLGSSLATRVECPTCHDLHSPAAESNLRVTMDENKLCLCCHEQMPELSRQVYLPMQKEKEVIESGDCRSCHNK